MITRFHVENYKALRNVTLDLTPIHVLIGPNDSGKTSLLHALASLGRSSEMPLPQAMVGRWEEADLIWNRSRELALLFQAQFDELGSQSLSYELACHFQQGPPLVDFEQGVIDGKVIQLRAKKHNAQTTFVFEALQQQENEMVELARKIRRCIYGTHYYRWLPGILALPVAASVQSQFRMQQSGFGLAGMLDGILSADIGRASALLDRFRKIFPSVKSIKLRNRSAFVANGEGESATFTGPHAAGKGIYFQLENPSLEVAASQAADGMLFVLAYLTILFSEDPPRILLLEEPENGVHPKLLTEVLSILRQLIKEHPKTQVLMTTHSPYVIDLFKPEEVTLCLREDDGAASVHRLSESELVQHQMSIFTLGEIWNGEGDSALAGTQGTDTAK